MILTIFTDIHLATPTNRFSRSASCIGSSNRAICASRSISTRTRSALSCSILPLPTLIALSNALYSRASESPLFIFLSLSTTLVLPLGRVINFIALAHRATSTKRLRSDSPQSASGSSSSGCAHSMSKRRCVVYSCRVDKRSNGSICVSGSVPPTASGPR